MANLLIVEDEQDIRDLMSFQLKTEGHTVTAVDSADKAISLIERGDRFQVLLIDWMLPGALSGLEFTRRLRLHQDFKTTPIIMITALTQPENIVAGLDAGADDYIAKPFDLDVLMARVRVQLRSLPAASSDAASSTDALVFEELKIEPTKVRVTVADKEVVLTSTEFKILHSIAERPGHVFTRTQLISQIQGEQVHVTGRTIDTHIAGLRKKLNSAGRLVETIRGIGYRFRDGN
ncbi:MAG: response regulator [Bacteriovoracia bacterium]